MFDYVESKWITTPYIPDRSIPAGEREILFAEYFSRNLRDYSGSQKCRSQISFSQLLKQTIKSDTYEIFRFSIISRNTP